MKITNVELGMLSVPLRVPFKTARRRVDSVEDVIVLIRTDTGATGYGEAPPTGVVTGDTTGGIIDAIRTHLAPMLIGRDVNEVEDLIRNVQTALIHNTSAKAAVDMALYDLYGQLWNIPVHKLLGGARDGIVTDITISVNAPEEMARDARDADRGGERAGRGGRDRSAHCLARHPLHGRQLVDVREWSARGHPQRVGVHHVGGSRNPHPVAAGPRGGGDPPLPDPQGTGGDHRRTQRFDRRGRG